MFCRRCGEKLLDDSLFCPKCGTKIENTTDNDKISGDAAKDSNNSDHDTVVQNTEIISKKSHNNDLKGTGNKLKHIKVGVLIAVLVLAFIIIVTSIIESKRCEYYDGCSNNRSGDTDYCTYHLCVYVDCALSKSYKSDYCYSHQCADMFCYNVISSGSKYCAKHTCNTIGCYNQVSENTTNCSAHQVDIRTRLGTPYMYFTLNSVGGIDFKFGTTNLTDKTIKYVRFKVYLKNAVGDSVKEDITRENYIDIEIIGPISAGDSITFGKEIIGYCDNLARIDIRTVTIIYTDGTIESGMYNYYYTK